MIFLSDSLPATKTYAKRTFSFLWVDGADHGTLTISQTRGKKEESEAYLVEEDTEALLYGSRVFLLKKEDGEIYEVALGREDRCTCKAGLCGLACKHTAAIRGLLNAGQFDGGHDLDAMVAAYGPAVPATYQ